MDNRNIYINNTPLDLAIKNWRRALLKENCFHPLRREKISVENSINRVTAEPVFARIS